MRTCSLQWWALSFSRDPPSVTRRRMRCRTHAAYKRAAACSRETQAAVCGLPLTPATDFGACADAGRAAAYRPACMYNVSVRGHMVMGEPVNIFETWENISGVTWWRPVNVSGGLHGCSGVTWWRGSLWTSPKPGKTSLGSHGDGSPEGRTDGCDWRVVLEAWITSLGDHTDGCDRRVRPNVWRGRLLGLVPHQKLMVGGAQHIGGGSPHPLG
jgi:hypothetical protein